MRNFITSIILSYILRRGIKYVDYCVTYKFLNMSVKSVFCTSCRRHISTDIYLSVNDTLECPFCKNTITPIELNKAKNESILKNDEEKNSSSSGSTSYHAF